MPTFRALTALLTGTLLLAGFPAAAAPPAARGCPLLVDGTGDATGTGPVGAALPSDAALDVVSADLDTRRGVVTGVIRLAELGPVDPMAPTGRAYYLNFRAQGAPLYLSASVQASGEVLYRVGAADGARRTLGTATGTLDVDRDEITISAPAAAFRLYARRFAPGLPLTQVEVLTQRLVSTPQTGGLTLTADAATSDRVHVTGSRGCAAPA